MVRIRNRAKKRRRRASLAQMAAATARGLHTAYRHARVGVWRFKRSPDQQDRATAIATFTFIGLFALGSVDAVVTGGADFGPTAAYASEYRPARAPTTVQPIVTVMTNLAPAPVEAAPGDIDYSFTGEELLGGPIVQEPRTGEPGGAAKPKKTPS
jgi:hypothetical protein